ncbi:hypothetical protein JHK84_044901 [Glycine max]|nr:hypothetical protein JHK86_044790 [Glycine max]KAG4951540.1 hypothetical protein JHK85_045407 [Glycine max]KAG5107994.1 hypothetical protein JHK84_044901 [Glycine max]
MWDLVARDRWVIFAAFSTLIVVVVRFGDFDTAFLNSIQLHSTECKPCYFSQECAVVDSAMRGFGNMRLLILLCVALGICRYKWWLEKLADISLRQSAAYGVWNFSFNILYHSTQVIAVLFGGMSILAGHITEKLRRSWSNKAPESITLSFNCPSYKKLSIALKASSGTSLKVTSEDMLSFGIIVAMKDCGKFPKIWEGKKVRDNNANAIVTFEEVITRINEKKEDGAIVVVGVDTRLTTPRSVKETQEGGISVLNNTKSHNFVGGVTRRTKTLELSLVSNTPLVNS